MRQLTRRTALRGLALASLLGTSGGRFSAALAQDHDPRLLVVYLRGGLDALAALPPNGDPHFLRMPRSCPEFGGSDIASLRSLDPLFGLHPALEPLFPFYAAGELLIFPATGIPDIGKSHSVAENALFDGYSDRGELGWPSRAASIASRRTPLIVTAEARDIAIDALLDLSVTNPALEVARLCAEGAFASSGEAIENLLARQHAKRKTDFTAAATSAAFSLAQPDGPRIALLHLGGVDTHAAQGGHCGRLAGALDALATGLVAFTKAGSAIWRQTVVLVVTEFGRSVHLNEHGGTDHGNASLTLLMGGSVAGGRIDGQWPGLAPGRSFDETGIAVTVDVRSIVKAVLADHLRLSTREIAQVAPSVSGHLAARGLFKV
jgi:uncharacterized protein (DUF1501 family)